MKDYFELAAQDAQNKGINLKDKLAKKFCAVAVKREIAEAVLAGDFVRAAMLKDFNELIQNY